MKDSSLLVALLNRTNFELIVPHLKKDIVSADALHMISMYHQCFKDLPDAYDLTVDDILALVKPRLRSQEQIDDLELQLSPVRAEVLAGNTPLTDAIVKYYETLRLALKLRNAGEDFILGKATDMGEASQALVNYEVALEAADVDQDDLFITTDLEELVKATVGSSGLNWRLPELNRMYGPLRQGDLMIVAARPETGKTTLLASEVSHMAEQLPDDRPVLWLCNEEDGKRIQLRVYQASLGITREDLLKNTAKNKKLLEDNLGNLEKIRVCFNPYLTIKHVEAVCKEVNPGLIIIDQLDKVHGFKAERKDLEYKALYQWARVLSNRYGPTLVVCQADGTAEGQRWLTQHQLDGSKTAKQGEADAIMMIGKDNDPAFEFDRFIHAPKNKLSGGPLSIEAMRHGRIEVKIKPEIARYE